MEKIDHHQFDLNLSEEEPENQLEKNRRQQKHNNLNFHSRFDDQGFLPQPYQMHYTLQQSGPLGGGSRWALLDLIYYSFLPISSSS